MSKIFKKNDKKVVQIIALALAVVLVAMIAWIAIDKFLSVSTYFEDQTFAGALADSLGKPARFINAGDLEEFEVMVVSCYVSADPNYGYQTVTMPYITLGKADYADYIIENTRTMNEEKEEEEEEEHVHDESDTSHTHDDEPQFDTVQVYATPSTVEDIVKFANLRVLSVIDSSTAYDINYNAYVASMYAQLTGSTSSVSASTIYKTIVPSDLDSLKDLEALTKLEYLGVAYSAVADLEGIEKFENLVVLDASNCKLTTIEGIENASNLLGLYVGSNSLTSLAGVEKLNKLETLEFSSNKVEELPKFSENSALVNISATGNKLTEAAIDLKNLKSLYLNENEIKTIDIKSPVLETLDVSDNNVIDLTTLSGLTTLEGLDLSGNKGIIDISPLASLKNLTTLGLVFDKDNVADKLTDISALKDMTKLESLSISYTGVSDISAIAGMKELTTLVINNSKVNDISAIEKLEKLTSIDLSENEISDISKLGEKKKVTSVNLSGNKILDVTAMKDAFAADTVTTINLKDNMITDWEPLKGYTKATISKDNNSPNKVDKDETSKEESTAETSDEVSE